MELGAGREKKEDPIDFSAGIVLHKKVGDAVQAGEPLATFYTASDERFSQAEALFQQAVQIRPECPPPEPLVYARVTASGVERVN